MGRHYSHLTSAVKILDSYQGAMPFNSFIRAYFSKEKKYGSKDRRSISGLCYAFFRTGHLLKKGDKAEKIIASVFLTEQAHSDFLAEIRPALNEQITTLDIKEKLSIIEKNADEVFPFFNELSAEIDQHLFLQSLLIQPLLFLRIRPGKNENVLQKLASANIPFESAASDCLVLTIGTKVERILKINEEVVIQDQNSQKVLDFLPGAVPPLQTSTAWDCCAGSGGKSILLYDRLKGKVRLTVSDIRETILSNLHTRLHNAGIPFENSYLKDLTESSLSKSEKFDIVLCDAPCTGSGTWSRTPEQLFYFQRSKIQMYAAMQKKIISHSINMLHKGSLYFYITCSVFSEENEQQVKFILENFKVKQVHLEYLKGYEQKADTLFVAVFKKS